MCVCCGIITFYDLYHFFISIAKLLRCVWSQPLCWAFSISIAMRTSPNASPTAPGSSPSATPWKSQIKQQQEQAQKLKTSIRIFKNTLKYLSNASYQPASQSIPLPPKEKKKLLSLFLFCSLFLCIYLTQREVKGSTEIMHPLVVD